VRSRATFNAQDLRLAREDQARRAQSLVAPPRQPAYDSRGIGYAAAGDTAQSRIPVSGEERVYFHSDMGLTSHAHENRGTAGGIRGHGSVARGIPGFAGHVPGKRAENVFSDTWSKSNVKSLDAHFTARSRAPKTWSTMTHGGTMIASAASDAIHETPLSNSSYQDRVGGWSACHFTGCHVQPAGARAPAGRQDNHGSSPPAPPSGSRKTEIAIHGYTGFVPGRYGENVVGERQSTTNAISDHLFRKACVRNTQR